MYSHRRYLFCCIWVMRIQLINPFEQCDNELTLRISAPFDVYQDVATIYEANSSSYGKDISFSFDTSDPIDAISNKSSSRRFSRRDSDPFFDVIELPPAKNDVSTDYVTFPIMVGVIAFFHNVQNVTRIVLSPQVIADIYLGKIILWNEKSIQELNPQVQLPNEYIVVTAMDISKGMDAYFLSWALSSYSNSWNKKYGTSYDWQNGQNHTYFRKISQMFNYLTSKPNTIGFTIGTNFFDKKPLPSTITILNSKGGAVDLSLKSITAALKSIPKEKVNSFDVLSYVMQNGTNGSYPFIYFNYLTMNRIGQVNNGSCCAMTETLGYIDYFLDFIKSTSWNKYGYLPLSPDIVQYIKANILPLIFCNETSSYLEYLDSRRIEKPYTNWALVRSMPVVCGVLAAIIAVVASVGFIYYQKRYKLVNNETLWKINPSEIVLIEKKTKDQTSLLSLNSYPTSLTGSTRNVQSDHSNSELVIANWKRNDIVVRVSELPLVVNLTEWRKTRKMLIYKFVRDINHENLCSLFGISMVQMKPCLITQFCPKGTLNHVLEHCPFDLLVDVKYSLAYNVISGLKYLHQKMIIHGSLSSITCFVDDTWNVKIADWAVFSIISCEHSGTKKNNLNTETKCTVAGEEPEAITELIKILYRDPDSIYPDNCTMASDLYSCGMLLFEIFTRQLPFNEEVEMSQTTYAEIIRKKIKKVYCVPQMPECVPRECRGLILNLVSPGDGRPDIITVHNKFRELRGNNYKNVVDVMMKLMEKHMEDLEEKVIERTSELVNITNRMRDLLNEMLPPQIADKFIRGESVRPEFYECATIFFSDIVGFTTISAKSTPYQVMDLLNDLWQLFDGTMENFDAYKVDTIGDAYMVASGLPIRNGVEHCSHIANFALTLLNESNAFIISHLPEEKLRVRMGINSGPVTAGIVGHKMPQYCIFGDTVNTASRMESSSLPMKIHVSDYSHTLFKAYFPNFQFEYRGETEIKGKGSMKTYWLLDSTIA